MVMMLFCPALFAKIDSKIVGLWKIQIGLNTILYPLLVAFLLWRLGFTKDMYMRTNQERLGPLMASILFYFWNYYVFHKDQNNAPMLMKSFLLATFISVSLLFLTTIFTKMSMHVTAISGASCAMLLLAIQSPCISYLPFLISIFVLALVVWARLYLKEHTKAEVISGLIIGIVSQAFGWYFYLYLQG
jgi:membrane-associated phospholipid phosphatase